MDFIKVSLILLFIFQCVDLQPFAGCSNSEADNEEEECVAEDRNETFQWTTRDQIGSIAYEEKLGTSLIEIKRKLKRVYGNSVLSDRQIERYYKDFKEGKRKCTARSEGSGRPASAVTEDNVALVRELMKIRRNWTSCEIAQELNVSVASAWNIIKAAGFKWAALKWVPYDLSEQQKEMRVVASVHNLNMFRRDPRMLGRIISIDETYLQFFTPRDPNQAREWRRPGEACLTQSRLSLSDRNDKVLIVAAVHQDQIVAWEYLEKDEKMTKERYVKFLNESLRNYIQSSENFNENERPIILQNNAPSHNSALVRNYIAGQNWTILDHPAYSPDMNPLDIEVIQKIKRPLKGRRFSSREELLNAAAEVINSINEAGNIASPSRLPLLWERIIKNKGAYLLE